MGIISVDNIESGMILADKVYTSKRMMLLPEGVTLTDAHLVTFKTWGITEVNVEGDTGGGESGELSPEELEELQKELSFIFKHNDLTTPLIKKIFELACQYPRKSS
jgi:hypothetical protein